MNKFDAVIVKPNQYSDIQWNGTILSLVNCDGIIKYNVLYDCNGIMLNSIFDESELTLI